MFTAPPGAHICLKCAYVFAPPVGYSESLSTVNETCNKTKDTVQKKVGAHLTSPPAHFNRVCTCSPVFHSEECDEQASITGLLVLGCCSSNELRGTF